MANGKSRPVSTTRNSDTPSIPTCHEIPNSVIHVRFTSNWKPASLGSKAARTQSVMAPVAVANRRATRRGSSTRPRGTSATTSAPTNGRMMAAVNGEVATVWALSAARIEKGTRTPTG